MTKISNCIDEWKVLIQITITTLMPLINPQGMIKPHIFTPMRVFLLSQFCRKNATNATYELQLWRKWSFHFFSNLCAKRRVFAIFSLMTKRPNSLCPAKQLTSRDTPWFKSFTVRLYSYLTLHLKELTINTQTSRSIAYVISHFDDSSVSDKRLTAREMLVLESPTNLQHPSGNHPPHKRLNILLKVFKVWTLG